MLQAADGQPHLGLWAVARGAPIWGCHQHVQCSNAASPVLHMVNVAAVAALLLHASAPNGCARVSPIALDEK